MKIVSFLLIFLIGFVAQGYDHKFYNMTPPKAKSAQKRQVSRMAAIRDFKFAGFIGEADDGFLKIHDISKATPANQKVLRQLVKDENKDRAEVYKEIIIFNKLKPNQKDALIQNFFEVNRNTDAKGTFYFEKKVWQKHY